MPSRQTEPTLASHSAGFARSAERGRIVSSKLSAPLLRPGIVERTELVGKLLSTADFPVVLLSAPPGYGKTTLVALWAQLDERPFAWVSLDGTDNDAAALVEGVLTALDRALGLDPATGDGLRAPQPPLEDVVLPALVDACAAAAQRFVLVLDDLHRVTETRCHTIVGYLAERLPDGCQLVLSTRTDPPLPLASWRAHRRLAELRAPDLALGSAEAGALLEAAGVRLVDDRVAQLVERTEGWPAALYLAALSLRDRPGPEDFVDQFAGTSRHVADFLSEDVLARLPHEVIDFLLGTCVADELTASLCDLLTGRTDADAMLRTLERRNLFVVPLDEERHAFRYHHLFVEYLRAELARREPERVAELHRRACGWHREHGLIKRAVAHAQAAGDVRTAADLVATAWLSLCNDGQVETVRSWLSGFDDVDVEAHPPLAIAAARVAAVSGERERAAHFAEVARRGSWDGPMPDGTASLESALAIMSSALGLDGVSGMRAAAARAVELERASSPWRPLALMLRGIAETLGGGLADARRALDEAVLLTGGEGSTAAISLAYRALVSLREGDAEDALEDALRANAVAERPGIRDFMPSTCTFSVVAHLLDRRGDREGAEAAVARTYALMPRLTEAYWWQMVVTRLLLAPVLASFGRADEAAACLAESEAVLAAHDDAGTLPDWHERTVRELHLRPARAPSTALSDAEHRILRLLASDLTLREIGRELYLSLNTVKTHTRSIYRKLGVSSRAEAVAAARASVARRGDSPRVNIHS